MKHLWEITHPYYCWDNEVSHDFVNWQDFVAEISSPPPELKALGMSVGLDPDMNLLFRFDWSEEPNFTGQDIETPGTLRLFYVQQRRGTIAAHVVPVTRADEPEVAKFLQERLNYLMKVWTPLIPEMDHAA
ncbi:hypothetical protein J2857_006174 [Neorhizobium galegae]|uniref:hypothetical protein n=1 Tax=Neorhizobium galegae TaxID=399 RepID=UPI001AE25129|nr:hypothetical protein [Neorhizobium galegae]MBP2563375.1 hypothetical protein [Neorhizobium galegae]